MTGNVNIPNFCRCCLLMQPNDLIEMKESTEGGSLIDMFLESSSIILIQTVDDSPKICKVCVELLKSAFYFRMLCRKADGTLRKCVEKTSTENSSEIEKPMLIPFLNKAMTPNTEIEMPMLIPYSNKVTTQNNKLHEKNPMKKSNAATEVVQISDSEDEVSIQPVQQQLRTTSRSREVDKQLSQTDNISGFNRLSMQDENAMLKREMEKIVAEYYPAEVTHQCPYCMKMFEQIEHLIQHISELH